MGVGHEDASEVMTISQDASSRLQGWACRLLPRNLSGKELCVVRAMSSGNRKRWLVAAVVLAVALVVGGPFVYINLIQGDAPDRLDVATDQAAADTTSGGASGSLDGTWTAGSGSQAGYRVKEVLLGQNTEAVGRTTAVTGQLTVSGTQVTSGSFTVDLTKVTSDEQRRDRQFQGRIMDTATYPTATFKLVQPITLGSLPADGATVTATASGELTVHGTTKPVTVQVTAQRSGDSFKVSGAIPVTFADYAIPNPSFGPVTTEDHGEIEFLLAFTRT
jgi:polyisoprenoid-binding protein YceI